MAYSALISDISGDLCVSHMELVNEQKDDPWLKELSDLGISCWMPSGLGQGLLVDTGSTALEMTITVDCFLSFFFLFKETLQRRP